jgi:hypothetical protein
VAEGQVKIKTIKVNKLIDAKKTMKFDVLVVSFRTR